MNLSQITIKYYGFPLDMCSVYVNNAFNVSIINSDFHGMHALFDDNIIQEIFRNRGMMAQSFMRTLYFLAKD